jgi:S-adenosylmethionine hydrolase
MSRSIIALTTDFGQADGYVGAMKGVILGICPEATLVDICHDIPPQSVHQAAYILSSASPYFPAGTVHLVVVDPGVGSERRPIAVQTQRATYVAPDNGVLGPVLLEEPAQFAVHLSDPAFRLPRISATFHGRDIFAPVAAHIAAGCDPRGMGGLLPLQSLVTLPTPQPEAQSTGTWSGQVLHIDRFGNLVTNFRHVNADAHVIVAGHHIAGLSHTFSDVAPGKLVAYMGSSGYLEIAVREGHAAIELGMDVGDPLQIQGLQ